ncbi:MAG: hypothetical protein FWG11_08005 [Promicromonosporaceae bacterium]|nr:hypothetical protein [Promicromonosporaceae bacterium]
MSDDELHALLVERDYVLGLEATIDRIGRDKFDEAELRAEITDLRAHLAEVAAHLEAAVAERDALRASATWRAGRLVLAPLSMIRALLGRSPQ